MPCQFSICFYMGVHAWYGLSEVREGCGVRMAHYGAEEGDGRSAK